MAVIKYLSGKKTLKSQIKYLEKEGKTDALLKSGINCTVDNIEREFTIVKNLYHKAEGKQYYHYTQAFSPNDNITAEEAHNIGKEWIEKNITGYQIYLVTHIDKDHIHNHFLINSVSYETGKKLHISPNKLEDMKNDSNRICKREHLSQINLNRKSRVYKTDEEYRIEQRGLETWKGQLRNIIETERKKVKTFDEFKKNLKDKYNIEVQITKTSISFKHPYEKKIVSGKRLGQEYIKEFLETSINEENANS